MQFLNQVDFRKLFTMARVLRLSCRDCVKEISFRAVIIHIKITMSVGTKK